MSLFKSFWTVQGISPDARAAALRAADADGEELGVWLTRLINKVSAAERNAFAAANDSADSAEQTDDVNIAEAEEDADDKLSSIERAMRHSRAAGDAGSA